MSGLHTDRLFLLAQGTVLHFEFFKRETQLLAAVSMIHIKSTTHSY